MTYEDEKQLLSAIALGLAGYAYSSEPVLPESKGVKKTVLLKQVKERVRNGILAGCLRGDFGALRHVDEVFGKGALRLLANLPPVLLVRAKIPEKASAYIRQIMECFNPHIKQSQRDRARTELKQQLPSLVKDLSQNST